jgi:cytochrome oxidase Cu insertion factor (SCO1/SenC/PrrC family)
MARRWIQILLILGLQLLVFSLISCSQLPSTSPRSEMTPKISAGQKIPDLSLLDTQGNPIRLYPLLQKANKTALVFYRGYW